VVDWDQALQYMHNISHKKPALDLKVYLVMGATTYMLQFPMGENMDPNVDNLATVTVLKMCL